jgi:hypothetical protein
VPRRLDAVHDLAGAADRDADLGGNVLYPAVRDPRDDLHELELLQGQVVVRAEPARDGVPQLGLQPDQLAEQVLQVRRAVVGAWRELVSGRHARTLSPISGNMDAWMSLPEN